MRRKEPRVSVHQGGRPLLRIGIGERMATSIVLLKGNRFVFRRIAASVLAAVMAAAAFSQDSPHRLERSRVVKHDVATAWARAVRLLRDSPAIVNTLDRGSGILSFTAALAPSDARQQLLDADETGKQPHTVHVTISISEADQGTRLFVRASPNSGVFFTHSNGVIEKGILDAMESGTAWMPERKGKGSRDLPYPPGEAWEAAVEVLRASRGIAINAADAESGIVTVSTVIPSGELGTYASKIKKAIYPGAAHVTLWFEPVAGGTAVHTRMLLLELGSLAPVPLASTEYLESSVLTALERRLRGDAGPLAVAESNYRGKAGFWSELFSSDSIPADAAGPKLDRLLPVSVDHAWDSILRLISQNYFISVCDGRGRRLSFITAHLSQKREGYSSHRVQLTLSPDGDATRLTLRIPPSIEPAAESEMEMRAIESRIVTELSFREEVPWLIGGMK